MTHSIPSTLPRRHWLAAAAVLALTGFERTALAQASTVQVWKDPNCGCCQLWVEHLQANGFKVEVRDVGNTAARKRLGMPEKFGSCHTATVGGYVIEGHVPAADIHRLLKERPLALGLSVPGMPIGSPGMDGPEYKGRQDAYDVLLVQKDGNSKSFQHYPGVRRAALGHGRGASHRQSCGQSLPQARRDQEPGHATDEHGVPGSRAHPTRRLASRPKSALSGGAGQRRLLGGEDRANGPLSAAGRCCFKVSFLG